MKAVLTSMVLSFALVFAPGLARADSNVPNTSEAGAPAELKPNEVKVKGVSLSAGYKYFTGKLTVKAFVEVHGILKVKARLKGFIKDNNGYDIPVEVDDVLITLGDIKASCDYIKVSLVSVKVKVHDLKIVIRLQEAVLVLDGSKCDKKKLCFIAKIIHGKRHCFLIVKLLNELWGLCGKDGKDCDDGRGDDDCDKGDHGDCDKGDHGDCDKGDHGDDDHDGCGKGHGKGHGKGRGKS